jgi:Fe-S cluster biogenesis protein NfuA
VFPFSDEELKMPVEIVIQKVRPTLTLDGGDITLLGIKDAKVYVRLEGACKGCPSSANTLKYAIENRLKEEIHPDIAIVNVQHGKEADFQIG